MRYEEYYSLKQDKKKVKELYIRSFPFEERCPFAILLSKVRKNKGEFFAIYDQTNFIGLIYNIVYQDIVYIYYLAIVEKYRNNGYGTKVLNDMKKRYENKRIILMAETLDPNADNYPQRLNRSKFYSKNGYVYQGYTVMEYGVVYDMLGEETAKVSKAEFKELIKNYFGNWSYNNMYRKNTDIEK